MPSKERYGWIIEEVNIMPRLVKVIILDRDDLPPYLRSYRYVNDKKTDFWTTMGIIYTSRKAALRAILRVLDKDHDELLQRIVKVLKVRNGYDNELRKLY